MHAAAESFGAAPGNVDAEPSSQSVAGSTYPEGCVHDTSVTLGLP
jgi:hypothetical protein